MGTIIGAESEKAKSDNLGSDAGVSELGLDRCGDKPNKGVAGEFAS
jgi:hypothetical protein